MNLIYGINKGSTSNMRIIYQLLIFELNNKALSVLRIYKFSSNLDQYNNSSLITWGDIKLQTQQQIPRKSSQTLDLTVIKEHLCFFSCILYFLF